MRCGTQTASGSQPARSLRQSGSGVFVFQDFRGSRAGGATLIHRLIAALGIAVQFLAYGAFLWCVWQLTLIVAGA
jgi:hypothetical protein